MMKTFAAALLLAHASAQLGGGVDDHGCMLSAGYSYCAATDSCVRPFELAAGHVRLSPLGPTLSPPRARGCHVLP